MSCYNYQYTGMPDCSGRDGFMDMSGWQSWQRGMDGSRNNGSMSRDMNNSGMSSGMNNSGMSSGMNNSGMSSGMNHDSMSGDRSSSMRDGTAITPGWGDWRPEQNPVPPVMPPEKTCLDSGRFPLAMSYVPMQTWSEPLPLDKAMTRGTIFRELDLPFIMGRCR